MSDFQVPPPDQPSAGPPAASSEPPSPAGPPSASEVPPVRRRSSFWKRLLIVVVVLGLFGVGVLTLGWVMLSSLASLGGQGLQTTVLESGRDDEVVAVINMSGMLGEDQVHLVETFARAVGKDANVKAVVLRVNSPGGGISACDRIYSLLRDLRDGTDTDPGKKLVVSMGGVAASGGYYISAPADAIFAEPTTITGSIGVLASWPMMKGTMEKIGVRWVVVRSSPAKAWKAAPNYFEDPADYQMADLQATLDQMHKRFEAIILKERGGKVVPNPVTKTYTDAAGKEFTVRETEPFNGRIFLADRALKLKLIDAVGYRDDAIDRAAALAGLTDRKVVQYSARRSLGLALGLGGMEGLDLSRDVLEEMQVPRVMVVWKVAP